MDMNELALRLCKWIEGFGQPVKIATDSLAWDWPWIQEIFYDKKWPNNLDGKPASLYELVDSPFFERAVEDAFANHQPPLRRHHALDDARANKMVYEAWIKDSR